MIEACGATPATIRRGVPSGWEGLIAKRADAPYATGRSKDWLKLKCAWEQEFVIGGFTDPAGSRTDFGALLVGYHEDGQLRYAGKVGTGYSAATLRDLGARLRALETPESPFLDARPIPRGTHWTHPKLVGQIGFAEWTTDGRLRQPRFLGLRDDKGPDEVVRERAVVSTVVGKAQDARPADADRWAPGRTCCARRTSGWRRSSTMNRNWIPTVCWPVCRATCGAPWCCR